MPNPSDPSSAFSRPVQLSRLTSAQPHLFEETADTGEMKAAALQLDIPAIRKLRLSARLEPAGKRDWRLRGSVGATVTQECVVTLEPVVTRIDTDFTRLYSAAARPVPDGAELGEDDDIDIEPIPEELDIGAIALEEIALALPLYPRAAGAELPETAVDPDDPGEVKRENPFEALAALKDKLSGNDDT
ncbi:YceD family protein [Algicella marina]|nr:DUF177 domain-containing protein [Algicella marina]